MVDIVSIIIAVISLIGSLASAAFTAFISYYIDRTKRRSEARALLSKYRDPLTLSAYDLQSRFYNITTQHLLPTYLPTKPELVRTYTAFLIGQYFAWTFIFRREAQFLRFSTDAPSKRLNEIMERIVHEFSTDGNAGESAFMLWRGQQMAIGELMTERDEGGQSFCIGYANFARRYEEDEVFRGWFGAVEEGVTELAKAEAEGNTVAANRLRRLQHLLVDLTVRTGEGMLNQGPYRISKVVAAPGCRCDGC